MDVFQFFLFFILVSFFSWLFIRLFLVLRKKNILNKYKGQPGPFWHVHHDVLMEHCYDAHERAKFILEEKPRNEIPTRILLFRPVKGELPKEIVETSRANSEAYLVIKKTRLAEHRASKAFEKAILVREEAEYAYRSALLTRDEDKRKQKYDKSKVAYDEYCEAKRALDEKIMADYEADMAHRETACAYYKAVARNISAIEALHKKECPNCPWDGKTIFPSKIVENVTF